MAVLAVAPIWAGGLGLGQLPFDTEAAEGHKVVGDTFDGLGHLLVCRCIAFAPVLPAAGDDHIGCGSDAANVAKHTGRIRYARLGIATGDTDEGKGRAAYLGDVDKVQGILEAAGNGAVVAGDGDEETISGVAGGTPGVDGCRVFVIGASIKGREPGNLEGLAGSASAGKCLYRVLENAVGRASRADAAVYTEDLGGDAWRARWMSLIVNPAIKVAVPVDEFRRLEEEGHFPGATLRAITGVDEVAPPFHAEVATDAAGCGLCGIGRADGGPDRGNRIGAFEDSGDDRGAGDVLDKAIEKRLAFVFGVVAPSE